LKDSSNADYGKISFIDLAGSERAVDQQDQSKQSKYARVALFNNLLILGSMAPKSTSLYSRSRSASAPWSTSTCTRPSAGASSLWCYATLSSATARPS